MARAKGMRSITNDIKRRFNAALDEFAGEVAFEIEKRYEQCIDAFYSDDAFSTGSTPRFYKRTYSLYYGSSGFEDPYSDQNIQKFGDSYFAGIQVDSAHYPTDPYRANRMWVFDRAFWKGIHGFNRNDIIKINKNRYGENRVGMKPPTTMKPAPKTLMDREFKKLTKTSNMDAMFKPIMDRHLTSG